MRCICCDKNLSDFESTRKHVTTGEYIDMCNRCYATIDKQVLSYERYDLYDEEQDESNTLGSELDPLDFNVDK